MTTITKKSIGFVPPAVLNSWKEDLYEQLALQKDRLILWCPVFLALGIGFYFSLSLEPPLVVGLVFAAISYACLLLVWPLKEIRRLLWLVAMAVAFTVTGFTAAQIRTANVYTPMLVKKLGPVDVTGTVHSIEDLGEETGSRVMLSKLEIERLEPDDTPRFVRLRLRKDEGLAAGQRVRVLAELNPPSPPVMPGAFDFQLYSYFRGIGAVGFIYTAPEILEGQQLGAAELLLEKLRLAAVGRIQDHLEYPEAGVAMALMTGKRKAISEEDQEAMRAAGLAHMLAISGLHVGLVAGVLFFFSRLIMALFPGLALRHPIKKYAAGLSILGALAYTLLVGAPVPTQRAMMMTGIVLMAIIIDRTAISLRLVAFAAFVVLLIAPESLLSASFHMSFAAVVALVAFYEWLRPTLSRWYSGAGWVRKLALYFVGVSLTSLIAGLATGMFALYHFQRFALYGLLGNLAAVPILAFAIMPMVALSGFAMVFGLEALSLAIMEQGIAAILEIAHWVAGMEGAVLLLPAWPLSALVSFVFASLFFMLGRGWLKAVAFPFLLAGIIVISLYKQPDILISSSYKLIFYQTENDLYVSAKNTDRFTLESWERLMGVEEGESVKWPKEGDLEGLRCGEHGCHIELKGQKIAFSRNPQGLEEDCAWADILIAPDPVDKWHCAAGVVVDKFDTWRGGSHALWLGENGTTIKTADELRGVRPWVAGK